MKKFIPFILALVFVIFAVVGFMEEATSGPTITVPRNLDSNYVKTEGMATKNINQSGASDGQVIEWNDVAGQWIPATDDGGAGGYPADSVKWNRDSIIAFRPIIYDSEDSIDVFGPLIYDLINTYLDKNVDDTDDLTEGSSNLYNQTHTGDVTGATALAIGDDKVTEADLKAVNGATDEDILTYESTTGDYEWHTPAEIGLVETESDPTLTDDSLVTIGPGSGSIVRINFDVLNPDGFWRWDGTYHWLSDNILSSGKVYSGTPSDDSTLATHGWAGLTYLALAGGTMTGGIDMGDQDIYNIERIDGDTIFISGDLISDFAGGGLNISGANALEVTWEDAADLESDGSISTGKVADNEIDYSNVTFADFDYQTAWRVFYSNTDGDVTELALGSDGTYLKSNGASSAPTFDTPAGSGDMLASAFDDSLVSQMEYGECDSITLINGTDTIFISPYGIRSSVTPAHGTYDLITVDTVDADKWKWGSDILTLPQADGSANQILQTDGSLTLGWANQVLSTFDDQTAWRVFYSNTDGDVTELALGADGTYLKSNGASSAPTFDTPAGGGGAPHVAMILIDSYDSTDTDSAWIVDGLLRFDGDSVGLNCDVRIGTGAGEVHLAGSASAQGKALFYEDTDNGTNAVTLQGPASTGDITLTLPSSDGDADQVLSTNGSGVMSWVANAGGATDKDLVATSPLLVDGGTNVDDILAGSDGDVTMSVTVAKDIVTTAPLTGAVDNVIIGTDADITLGITVAKDLVTTAPLTGGTDNILTGADADVTLAVTVAKDIVTTAPLTGAVDNVIIGTDADITLGITVAKDLVTTSPLSGGTNDIFPGADSDITISIADADDDGSTKGAASFDNTDFDATGGNVTIVDDGHAHTNSSVTLDITDLNWANDWMIAYSNGDGLQELAFNDDDGKFLQSQGEGALDFVSLDDGDVPNDITIDLATLATTVTISDDESTDDNHEVVFTTDNSNLESDGTFHYNPSSGIVTATAFSGTVTEVNNLETNDPPNVADTEFYIGDGAGSGNWRSMSGDGELTNAGALTVKDDLHAHVYSNIDEATSANWISRVSDETGTGLWVFATAPTFTTSITMGAATVEEAELEILEGATPTTTEFNYVDGVTSAIQTQLDAKSTKANIHDTLYAHPPILSFDNVYGQDHDPQFLVALLAKKFDPEVFLPYYFKSESFVDDAYDTVFLSCQVPAIVGDPDSLIFEYKTSSATGSISRITDVVIASDGDSLWIDETGWSNTSKTRAAIDISSLSGMGANENAALRFIIECDSNNYAMVYSAYIKQD